MARAGHQRRNDSPKLRIKGGGGESGQTKQPAEIHILKRPLCIDGNREGRYGGRSRNDEPTNINSESHRGERPSYKNKRGGWRGAKYTFFFLINQTVVGHSNV